MTATLTRTEYVRVTGPKGGVPHIIERKDGNSLSVARTIGCAIPAPKAGWSEASPGGDTCPRCQAAYERRTVEAEQADVLADAERKLGLPEGGTPVIILFEDEEQDEEQQQGPNLSLGPEEGTDTEISGSTGLEALVNGQPTETPPASYTEQLTGLTATPTETQPLDTVLAPVPVKETLAARRARQLEERKGQSLGKCLLCGKPLKWDESSFRGVGPGCYQRVVEFLLHEQPEAKREGIEKVLQECSDEEFASSVQMARDITSFDLHEWKGSEEDLKAKYVPLPEVRKQLNEQNRSQAAIARLMGGDRNVRPAAKPYWRAVYYLGKRWLPKECLKHLDEVTLNRPKKAAVSTPTPTPTPTPIPAEPVAASEEGASEATPAQEGPED